MRKLTCLVLLVIGSGTTGCATRAEHLRAARVAATDWRTWAPIAAGIAFDVLDGDRDVSNELAGSPTHSDGGLIGDRDTAETISDMLLFGSLGGAVLASGVESLQNRSLDPMRGTVFAGLATQGVTMAFKEGWKRQRPNGEDDESFFSGHASHTAWSAASMRYAVKRNRRIHRSARPWIDGALTALPLATGLLRVEAKKHYPSDVLVGWGVGNFFGTYVGELEQGRRRRLTMRPVMTVGRQPGRTTVRLGASLDL